MKKVLVFGTFDGLHKGHLDFFRQAREYGDYLVAVVGRDSSVKVQKNKQPKYNEQERLKEVHKCGLVDEAILGDERHNPHEDSYSIIKRIIPDVICLGYDQKKFLDKLKDELKKMGLRVEIKVLNPYKPEKYKSSLLNK